MVTVNSNWLALSVTLSDLYLLYSYKLENPRRVNVHKSELAPDYSLLLVTALMHLMRTFIEESLPLTCNLSHDAQKHVRFVIVPYVVSRSRIKHVTQKAQGVGSC